MKWTENVEVTIDGERIRFWARQHGRSACLSDRGWALYNPNAQLISAIDGVAVPYPNVTTEMALRYVVAGRFDRMEES